MQRQFTIELRVDFADESKKETMKKEMARCARMMLATAKMLSDGQDPEAGLFSDDFFMGHEELNLLDNDMGEALAAPEAQEAPVPQELMDALK